ncbi:hypothetical protein HaLaN_22096, partial [Haematococcus lacustris]
MLLATDLHHAASIAASLPRVLHCLVSPHSAPLVFTTQMALRHGCGQLLEVLLQHDSPSLLQSASSALLLMASDEAVQGGVLDSADMAASQAVLEASQAALHTLMAAVQSEGCARALAAQDCGLLAHLQLLPLGVLQVQAVAAGALARFAAYLGL